MLALWLFLVIFYYFKSNSYECLQNANNCTSCNDAITFRYLFQNNCLCNNNYFENKASNAVCI